MAQENWALRQRSEQLQQKVELINRSRSQLVQFLRGLANSTSLSQACGATPSSMMAAVP